MIVKISWYDTGNDFEDDIYTSVMVESEDVNYVCEAIDVRKGD